MFRAAKSCSRCHRVLGYIPEPTFPRKIYLRQFTINRILCRLKTDDSHLSTLFTPIPVKPNPDDINVGAELSGQLNRNDLIKVLNSFYQRKEIKLLAAEHSLDDYLFHQTYTNFRKYCLEVKNLPVDLHIAVSDVLQGAGHVSDIFPYFLRFAKQMFPHIECMDDLKKISDLRSPPNWYPEARAKSRKIIFHAGPTNSGKTYHALERFLQSKSGVYCGPLKLLATEVYRKANERGTPCDLVTGEERKHGINENEPASHISCTVEMTSLLNKYEVAVIDEIQMIKDPTRGWAWTRALLGLIADEIHVCGEEAAVDLIKNLMMTTNENVEVCTYKRLTELHIEDAAVNSLDNIRNGDCIVCFNKNDVYSVSRGIEGRGKEVAVIYGGLPPNTKLAQAQKFNDPNNSCNVLIATDAIGMGLNLSIRRVIFYSLMKPTTNEKGEKEIDTISVSQALQIAGRAGRFNTQYDKGYVTTFKHEDLKTLQLLLSQQPEPLIKAGLHPTAEQIELYAYHLPHSSLSKLMDIFVTLSTVDDSLYFMCGTEDFKFLADMIEHIPLNLRARYIFCCAPLNRKMVFVCSLFLKYARQYSQNELITSDWVCHHIGWPLGLPKTILDLVHLESVFDILDLYLWFSYRFPDIFVDQNRIRDIQIELDAIIQQGVLQITRLLHNSSKVTTVNIEEDFSSLQKKPEESSNIGKGRLTERLIAQGLLTPSMLEELKNEWAEGQSTKRSTCNSTSDEPKENQFKGEQSAKHESEWIEGLSTKPPTHNSTSDEPKKNKVKGEQLAKYESESSSKLKNERAEGQSTKQTTGNSTSDKPKKNKVKGEQSAKHESESSSKLKNERAKGQSTKQSTHNSTSDKPKKNQFKGEQSAKHESESSGKLKNKWAEGQSTKPPTRYITSDNPKKDQFKGEQSAKHESESSSKYNEFNSNIEAERYVNYNITNEINRHETTPPRRRKSVRYAKYNITNEINRYGMKPQPRPKRK